MAWRPYENLIDGELDNRTPGQVTGWMRFHRRNATPFRVAFNLTGDFHDDIRGTLIRLHNPTPSDRADTFGRGKTYMEGFSRIQAGDVGDITAGRSLGPWSQTIAERLSHEHDTALEASQLPKSEREKRRREFAEECRQHIEAGDPYYPYVEYPYIEWYSSANGRVVLELDQNQVEVVGERHSIEEQAPQERLAARRGREQAMVTFLGSVAQELAKSGNEDDHSTFGRVAS